MKWLRIWLENEERGKLESGIVIGVISGWLVVRWDDGSVGTVNWCYVKKSKWVRDPEARSKK